MARWIDRIRTDRSVVWLLLVSSAVAVVLAGGASTIAAFTRADRVFAAADARFWTALASASMLTLASLGVRALRWIFLLRRGGDRIPIRDAYIGYLSGFSLLFAPLLLGEIVVRAYVFRARHGLSPARTLQINIWERLCDVIALALLAWAARPLLLFLVVDVLLVAALARPTRSWAIALVTSIAAWLLPAAGLWLLVNASSALPWQAAQEIFSFSTLTLSPGGVLTTGYELIDHLRDFGVSDTQALMITVAARIATVGMSVALGVVMIAVHFAAPAASGVADHFDDIAHAYDAQIPADRRHALLVRKTALMRDVLGATRAGARGLDVGCGQGWYVARMRALGFAVEGIDASAGQVRIAAAHVGLDGVVRIGSALDVPAPDATYDFVYTINVLHHLPAVAEQRRAFTELARVLKPGGLLFVHEINTRNPLFRFYMGYVFPTMNCIDEGVERWLLPQRLGSYTDLPVRDVRYFTFLPEFLPQAVVRLLAPLERWLERSALAPYSAHYMAVLQKPA